MIREKVAEFNWWLIGLIMMVVGAVLMVMAIRAVMQYQLLIGSVNWNEAPIL